MARLAPDIARWLACIVPAVVPLACAELGLGTLALPAALSSPAGLTASAWVTCGILALWSLPCAVALALLQPWLERYGTPPAPALLAGVLQVSLVTALALSGVIAVQAENLEFRVHELMGIAVLTASTAGLALHHLAFEPAVRWLVARMPRLGQPRVVLAVLCVASAFLALAAIHVIFAPIHQLTLIRWLAPAMLVSMLAGAHLALPELRSANRRILIGVVLLWGTSASIALGARPSVPFVVFAHLPTAATLTASTLTAFDFDGDGSAPTWLGGADCAELDPTRGPLLRELPGDGIDQDCRGGDAASAPIAVQAPLWSNCALPADPISVLLLTIDSLRADALHPEIMPAVFAFARQSATFTRAYAPSSMTSPTFMSVFSGKPLADLNPRNVLTDPELHAESMLAERYTAAGYLTIGYNSFRIHQQTSRGFTLQNPTAIDYQPTGATTQLMAAALSSGVLESIARAGEQPFFLWAHYPDPHAPYKLAFAPDWQGTSDAEAYTAAVRYVDEQVGRLLTTLGKAGRLQRTVVVISADHGEQLGLRLREGHGPYLFEEGTRVPLVVWIPGCPSRHVDHPVSLSHLGASLAQVTRVPSPGVTWFAPYGELPVVVEDSGQHWVGLKRAVHWGAHKLIVDVQNGGAMLFDLDADPGETRDLYDAGTEPTRSVETAYQRWLDATGQR